MKVLSQRFTRRFRRVGNVAGRHYVAAILIATGITRLVVEPIRALTYMADHDYGMAAIIIGALLFATSFRRRYRSVAGRLVAMLSWALLWSWALDLSPRANAFWCFVVLGIVMVREMVRE